MGTRDEPGRVRRWALARLRSLVWSGTIVAYVVLAFGQVWRAGAGDMTGVEPRLAFVALIVQAFAFHAGVALLVVAAVAGVLRMKRALVALVPLLAWTLGAAAWAWVRPLHEAAPGEPVLTVFSANLLYSNRDAASLIEQIDAADPDVVVLQEFTDVNHGELERLLRERYAYARTWAQTDAFGQAVFSRLAFEREPTLWWGGEAFRVPQLEFEVVFDGRRVAVWDVHTLPPASDEYIVEQREMIVRLGERVRETMSGEDAPDAVVLAGDFNAPFATNQLRELGAAGLRDAQRSAGRGRGGTWPEAGAPLGWAPKLPLDHVLYSPGLRCVGAGVGRGFGSDHRPIFARLAWTPSVE